jgi:regulator of protease activity HflC (stomatin/prohibitin superfamily)
MEAVFGFLIIFFLGGSVAASSVKIVNQSDEALVETLGKYNGRKLAPGLNFILPFFDKVVFKQTIRERVLDVPAQQCITRDNVSITVDAVVYWRIVDMEKAYYRVENLQSAMVNLVLTQIRAEMGKLELDETFTARSEINEILLRELDISTDPWGVKVTRVELRDIVPSKAVQDSMELQMAAERKKRAAVLTSEGRAGVGHQQCPGTGRIGSAGGPSPTKSRHSRCRSPAKSHCHEGPSPAPGENFAGPGRCRSHADYRQNLRCRSWH